MATRKQKKKTAPASGATAGQISRGAGEIYAGAGKTFKVKFVSSKEIADYRNSQLVGIAMSEFRRSTAKQTKATININFNGITIVNEKTKSELVKAPIGKLKFVCHDKQDSSHFAAIVQEPTAGSGSHFVLYGFQAEKAVAIMFVRSTNEIFKMLYERMQQQRGNPGGARASGPSRQASTGGTSQASAQRPRTQQRRTSVASDDEEETPVTLGFGIPEPPPSYKAAMSKKNASVYRAATDTPVQAPTLAPPPRKTSAQQPGQPSQLSQLQQQQQQQPETGAVFAKAAKQQSRQQQKQQRQQQQQQPSGDELYTNVVKPRKQQIQQQKQQQQQPVLDKPPLAMPRTGRASISRPKPNSPPNIKPPPSSIPLPPPPYASINTSQSIGIYDEITSEEVLGGSKKPGGEGRKDKPLPQIPSSQAPSLGRIYDEVNGESGGTGGGAEASDIYSVLGPAEDDTGGMMAATSEAASTALWDINTVFEDGLMHLPPPTEPLPPLPENIYDIPSSNQPTPDMMLSKDEKKEAVWNEWKSLENDLEGMAEELGIGNMRSSCIFPAAAADDLVSGIGGMTIDQQSNGKEDAVTTASFPFSDSDPFDDSLFKTSFNFPVSNSAEFQQPAPQSITVTSASDISANFNSEGEFSFSYDSFSLPTVSGPQSAAQTTPTDMNFDFGASFGDTFAVPQSQAPATSTEPASAEFSFENNWNMPTEMVAPPTAATLNQANPLMVNNMTSATSTSLIGLGNFFDAFDSPAPTQTNTQQVGNDLSLSPSPPENEGNQQSEPSPFDLPIGQGFQFDAMANEIPPSNQAPKMSQETQHQNSFEFSDWVAAETPECASSKMSPLSSPPPGPSNTGDFNSGWGSSGLMAHTMLVSSGTGPVLSTSAGSEVPGQDFDQSNPFGIPNTSTQSDATGNQNTSTGTQSISTGTQNISAGTQDGTSNAFDTDWNATSTLPGNANDGANAFDTDWNATSTLPGNANDGANAFETEWNATSTLPGNANDGANAFETDWNATSTLPGNANDGANAFETDWNNLATPPGNVSDGTPQNLSTTSTGTNNFTDMNWSFENEPRFGETGEEKQAMHMNTSNFADTNSSAWGFTSNTGDFSAQSAGFEKSTDFGFDSTPARSPPSPPIESSQKNISSSSSLGVSDIPGISAEPSKPSQPFLPPPQPIKGRKNRLSTKAAAVATVNPAQASMQSLPLYLNGLGAATEQKGDTQNKLVVNVSNVKSDSGCGFSSATATEIDHINEEKASLLPLPMFDQDSASFSSNEKFADDWDRHSGVGPDFSGPAVSASTATSFEADWLALSNLDNDLKVAKKTGNKPLLAPPGRSKSTGRRNKTANSNTTGTGVFGSNNLTSETNSADPFASGPSSDPFACGPSSSTIAASFSVSVFDSNPLDSQRVQPNSFDSSPFDTQPQAQSSLFDSSTFDNQPQAQSSSLEKLEQSNQSSWTPVSGPPAKTASDWSTSSNSFLFQSEEKPKAQVPNDPFTTGSTSSQVMSDLQQVLFTNNQQQPFGSQQQLGQQFGQQQPPGQGQPLGQQQPFGQQQQFGQQQGQQQQFVQQSQFGQQQQFGQHQPFGQQQQFGQQQGQLQQFSQQQQQQAFGPPQQQQQQQSAFPVQQPQQPFGMRYQQQFPSHSQQQQLSMQQFSPQQTQPFSQQPQQNTQSFQPFISPVQGYYNQNPYGGGGGVGGGAGGTGGVMVSPHGEFPSGDFTSPPYLIGQSTPKSPDQSYSPAQPAIPVSPSAFADLLPLALSPQKSKFKVKEDDVSVKSLTEARVEAKKFERKAAPTLNDLKSTKASPKLQPPSGSDFISFDDF